MNRAWRSWVHGAHGYRVYNMVVDPQPQACWWSIRLTAAIQPHPSLSSKGRRRWAAGVSRAHRAEWRQAPSVQTAGQLRQGRPHRVAAARGRAAGDGGAGGTGARARAELYAFVFRALPVGCGVCLAARWCRAAKSKQRRAARRVAVKPRAHAWGSKALPVLGKWLPIDAVPTSPRQDTKNRSDSCLMLDPPAEEADVPGVLRPTSL